jgi:hypothetical protein
MPGEPKDCADIDTAPPLCFSRATDLNVYEGFLLSDIPPLMPYRMGFAGSRNATDWGSVENFCPTGYRATDVV